MPDIIHTTESEDVQAHVQGEYILMYVYLPIVFGRQNDDAIPPERRLPILDALPSERRLLTLDALPAELRLSGLDAIPPERRLSGLDTLPSERRLSGLDALGSTFSQSRLSALRVKSVYHAVTRTISEGTYVVVFAVQDVATGVHGVIKIAKLVGNDAGNQTAEWESFILEKMYRCNPNSSIVRLLDKGMLAD
ncbi:hypothetical protein QR680_002882 [Steinernema hermaphroditum]|uniref:Protein kinase domain-containing protein n=1 Tax=Steinernema hermaphroditum TaxID=289476 RepID=A0AA39H698_9BILA|nr:hypothetical protein QR680_002882 [Steinernema hermaphroditum]